jgi:hypothetical protein
VVWFSEIEEASNLLAAVEQSLGSSKFMSTYATVQTQLDARKHERKLQLKELALVNPKLHALRKVFLI